MPESASLYQKIDALRAALVKADLEPFERTMCERYLDDLEEIAVAAAPKYK